MNLEDKKRPSDNNGSDNEAAFTKRLKESNNNMASQEDVPVTTQPSHDDVTSPISIMSKGSCKIQTMTVSDQHATLLLTHDADNDNEEGKKEASSSVKNSTTTAGDGKETIVEDTTVVAVQQQQQQVQVVRSLLKITLVPFHKLILGSNPIYSPSSSDDEKSLKQNETGAGDLKPLDHHNPIASSNILNFLKEYEYKLKSESGAEYSYYSATPSSDLLCKIPDPLTCSSATAIEATDSIVIDGAMGATTRSPSIFGGIDVELISPANERQISRAMPSFGSTLIHETPDIYQHVVYPYIKSIIDSGSLDWINNVIDGKKETERLLIDTSQFVVSIDTKWRSHPSPLTTPRKECFGHSSVEDLYCLGIVKKEKDSSIIATLRDLRGEHIPMLKNLQKEGLAVIEKIYGIQSDQIRCFVHYQPQFYHFHVHFTRLENEIGAAVERGHLLIDIIQNLEMDPLYYTRRTITYKLKKQSPLHNLFIESNRTESASLV